MLNTLKVLFTISIFSQDDRKRRQKISNQVLPEKCRQTLKRTYSQQPNNTIVISQLAISEIPKIFGAKKQIFFDVDVFLFRKTRFLRVTIEGF